MVMKTFRFSCCQRNESGELVVIEGLITPYTTAETRTEALSKLHDWFIENKCRPYMEV